MRAELTRYALLVERSDFLGAPLRTEPTQFGVMQVVTSIYS
jgi:hypothetical protein